MPRFKVRHIPKHRTVEGQEVWEYSLNDRYCKVVHQRHGSYVIRAWDAETRYLPATARNQKDALKKARDFVTATTR
jgi:hypothetical protein